MNRSNEPSLSNTERDFVLQAIKERKRLDGREIYDYRNVNIDTDSELGNVTVTLGNTRVQACVSCEVIQPKLNRSTEGQLYFNVTLSPMASPWFELGSRSSAMAVEVTRILERCFKESRAVDTESLCIIAGQKVWAVRVDIHVLDYCGNVVDASALAAITALKHFRRPDVTVVGETATVHSISEREPVALSIHHIPVCVSFGFYHDGEYLLVDPSSDEEIVMEGKLVVSMNAHQELCALQLAGGVAVLPNQILRCVEIAKVKVSELVRVVKECFDTKDTHYNQSSILTTTRSEGIADMEQDIDDANTAVDNDNELPEMEITTVGKDTVQLKVNIPRREKSTKGNDKSVGVTKSEDIDCEEEDVMVVSGTDIGGFNTKTRSCNDDKDNSTTTKKRKTKKRRKY